MAAEAPHKRLVDEHIGRVATAKTHEFSLPNYNGILTHDDFCYALEKLPAIADKVESLYISQQRMTDDDAPVIAAMIRACPKLNKIKLDNNKFSDKGLEIIIDAIADNPRVRAFDFSFNPVSGSNGGKQMARLMEQPIALGDLQLAYVPLGDEGLAELAPAIATNRRLYSLSLSKNEQTEQGRIAVLDAVAANHHISDLDLGNFCNREQDRPRVDAMVESGNNKNLLTVRPVYDENPKTNPKTERRGILAMPLLDQQPATLDNAQLAILSRLRGLLANLTAQDKGDFAPIYALDAFMDRLPPLPQTAADLFVANAEGYAPLDNPRLWENPEAVLALLDNMPASEQNTLMTQTTARGVTLPESAMSCAPEGLLAEVLQKRDLQFFPPLMHDNGEFSPVLKVAIAMGDAPQLFTSNMWKGQPQDALTAAYSALPEHQKEEVTNLHTLRAELGMQSRGNLRGR